MARVRMQDIADELGLSKSTVSLALRGRPKIPEATRRLVLETAEKLGYQPDPALAAAARERWKGSARGEGYTLAFLADKPRESIFVKPHWEGAQAGAEALGYQLEFHEINDYASPKLLSRVLYNRGIQGLLVCHPHAEAELWALDWQRFAVLQVGRGSLPYQFHRAVEHSTLQMQLAMELALARDAQRIGICLFPSQLLPGNKLHIGRAKYMIDHECPPGVEMRLWVHVGNPRPDDMLDWLQEFSPEVLITANVEVPRILEQSPEPRPELIWLDCTDSASSGVVVNRFEAGRVAVSLLQGQMHSGDFGIPQIPLTTMIPPFCRDD